MNQLRPASSPRALALSRRPAATGLLGRATGASLGRIGPRLRQAIERGLPVAVGLLAGGAPCRCAVYFLTALRETGNLPWSARTALRVLQYNGGPAGVGLLALPEAGRAQKP